MITAEEIEIGMFFYWNDKTYQVEDLLTFWNLSGSMLWAKLKGHPTPVAVNQLKSIAE